MNWVLFMILAQNSGDGGVALQQTQFYSQESCEKARSELSRTMPWNSFGAHLYTVCVSVIK